MKKIVFPFLVLTMIIGTLLSVQAIKPDPETKAITKVIEEATIVADQVYTKAYSYNKQGTLASNRSLLANEGHANLQRVFTADLSSKFSKVWVEDQFSNIINGPEQIGFGVKNVEIKELSISGDKAQVTAFVEKYLIDRVYRDGRYFHDRLDGAHVTTATLVKNNGVWKISSYDSKPDFSYSKHTVTPE